MRIFDKYIVRIPKLDQEFEYSRDEILEYLKKDEVYDGCSKTKDKRKKAL